MSNSYDFDGVFSTGEFVFIPGDVIVTGRCFDEASIVYSKLEQIGYHNIPVFFNTMNLSTRGDHNETARRRSAVHKVNTLRLLHLHGGITHHYEDDPIQVEILRDSIPTLEVVHIENKDNKYYGDS